MAASIGNYGTKVPHKWAMNLFFEEVMKLNLAAKGLKLLLDR